MHDFTGTDPFNEEPIETLRQHQTRMDREALVRFYHSSLQADMLTREKPPRARYMRQLLRTWKEIAEREQATRESAFLSAVPLFLAGNPAGKTDRPNPVDTPAWQV